MCFVVGCIQYGLDGAWKPDGSAKKPICSKRVVLGIISTSALELIYNTIWVVGYNEIRLVCSLAIVE